MGRILITGGAGYIGSHVVALLQERGRDVLVVDDLSAGHRAALGGVPLIEADFGDPQTLDGVLAGGDVEGIVHLAAFAEVGASMTDPAAYYRNNLQGTLALLDAARRAGVRRFVFSSTAAVYGAPQDVPIREDHPTRPMNPYGETKLAVERALHWFHRAYGLRYVALRYFNAAGARPGGTIGEDHDPETHLIPRLLRSAAAAAEGAVAAPTPIFGTDYPTSDGTCIRDYVHVDDLARAHVLALDRMRDREDVAEAYNLGNGEGFSVREVVAAVERVVGVAPPTEDAPRRDGDPPILVASSRLARERLGWKPQLPSLAAIVETAWDWHREHPAGYDDRRQAGAFRLP